jgi:hypothetical protein
MDESRPKGGNLAWGMGIPAWGLNPGLARQEQENPGPTWSLAELAWEWRPGNAGLEEAAARRPGGCVARQPSQEELRPWPSRGGDDAGPAGESSGPAWLEEQPSQSGKS